MNLLLAHEDQSRRLAEGMGGYRGAETDGIERDHSSPLEPTSPPQIEELRTPGHVIRDCSAQSCRSAEGRGGYRRAETGESEGDLEGSISAADQSDAGHGSRLVDGTHPAASKHRRDSFQNTHGAHISMPWSASIISRKQKRLNKTAQKRVYLGFCSLQWDWSLYR